MADAWLEWGEDLCISPVGDILMAGSVTLSQQRILRRLLTNPTDYIWHPGYGAGLGQFVGQVDVAEAVEGATYAQMYQEASVARQPLPTVRVDEGYDATVTLNIIYTETDSTSPQALTFSVSI
jgi:hypothetical protein